MKRKIRVCGMTRNTFGFGASDTVDTLSLHVRVDDANGVLCAPIGWLVITFDGGRKGVQTIRVFKPPYVSHVIRGFTLTLPPREPRVCY